MFGYTVPVENILDQDDRRIYRSYYCETCHHLKEEYGFASTLTVNYEMTFMNLFFNSVFDDGMLIDGKPGGLFCIFRKSACGNEMMHAMAAYTVLVANNSLIDDVADDSDTLRGKLGLLWLNRAITKAKNEFPEYDRCILNGYEKLRIAEKDKNNDPFKMGTLSSQSLIDVMRLMLKERLDRDIEELFRGFGIWVYIMDAVEDLDDDFRDGTYNPFLVGVGNYVNKRKFIKDNIFTIGETMGEAIKKIQIQYVKLRPRLIRNAAIIDNIIYQGLPYSAQRVLHGDKLDLSCRNMINGKLTRAYPTSL